MKVRVYNDNEYVHTEMFKGDRITIEPHSYVVMEDDDATLFKGQYTPIHVDFDNRPLPTSYKMIRVERVWTKLDCPEAKVDKFVCQACGNIHATQAELDDHIDDNHLEALADKELVVKRRGRPRKDKAA